MSFRRLLRLGPFHKSVLQTPARLVALACVGALVAACDDKASTATSRPAAATSTLAATTPAVTSTTNVGATAVAVGQGTTPAKTYDCGAKDQKACPMQGWMKKVMAPASSADDGPALAKALTYVADHAPPGFTEWTPLSSGAAAKAKSGDVDGAKTSCKQCHDLYKDKYKSTMRDRAF